MRAGVEARRLELMADIGKCRFRLLGDPHIASIDQAIYVEHAEPDPFHMESANRQLQRFAFLQNGVLRRASSLALQTCHQNLKAVLGGFAVIGVGGHVCVCGREQRTTTQSVPSILN